MTDGNRHHDACGRARRRILKAESGELTGMGRRAMARHLAGCPACRAFRNHHAAVKREWLAARSWAAVPEASLAHIRTAADRVTARRSLPPAVIPGFAPAWRAWAAAAGLILLLGWGTVRLLAPRRTTGPAGMPPALLAMTEPLAPEDEYEAALAAWEALLALLGDGDLFHGTGAEAELQEWAHELLGMEES